MQQASAASCRSEAIPLPLPGIDVSTVVDNSYPDMSLAGPATLLREQRDMCRLFVGLICVLTGVGIQMVHSASLTSMPSQAETVFLSKHLVYLALATCCGLAASRITPSLLQQFARPSLIGLIIMLGLVLIPGIGTRVNGSQRWLRIGDLSLQPSELGRLILPIVAAKLLTDLRSKG